jgi:hypothetical protein
MPPRATAGDYQFHTKAGAVTLAAEFKGHSVPTMQGTFNTEDYVAVEVGLFGPAGTRIQLSAGDFALRINGKKPLASQPYGMVLANLKDPEWAPPEPPEGKQSKTKLGSGGQGEGSEPPAPVKVPIEIQRAMAQKVTKVALPEGDRAVPLAGLIFFQYRGKEQGIRSVELVYTGSAGKATIKLGS